MFCKVEHIPSINMLHSNVIGVLHTEYWYYFPFLFNRPILQNYTRLDWVSQRRTFRIAVIRFYMSQMPFVVAQQTVSKH